MSLLVVGFSYIYTSAYKVDTDILPHALSHCRVLLLLYSLYVVFVATFLALMLFFWLELFGDLAAGNMQVGYFLNSALSLRKFRSLVMACCRCRLPALGRDSIGFLGACSYSRLGYEHFSIIVFLNCSIVDRKLLFPHPPLPGRHRHGHLAVVFQGTDTALEWERNRKKTIVEYLPKLVLVGLIWIVTVLVYM